MSASYVSFRRSENKLKQARLQVAMGRIGFANNGPTRGTALHTRCRAGYALHVTERGSFVSQKKKFRKCTAAMRFTSEAGGDARARTTAGSLRPIYMRGARKFRKQLRAREGTEPTSLPATQA
jgi:hypothetical protein